MGSEWLSTPVFLSGEFHGQGSLVVYSPWGLKESDVTEQLTVLLHFHVNTSNIYFCLDFTMEVDLRKYEGNSYFIY